MIPFLKRLWARHSAFFIVSGLAVATLWVIPAIAAAATAPSSPTVPIPQVSIGVGQAKNPKDVATALQILLLLTVLSLAPTLLVLLTSFTRVIVVLSFVRTALGTQQVPPNQVLVGLALFLTFFIMAPVVKDVNQNALQPFLKNQISQSAALDRAAQPLRKFMFRQTREKDLQLFYSLTNEPRPATQAQVPTYILIPAFVISGAEDVIRDRLCDLRSVYRHRHGRGQHSALDGHDDDPARDHLSAVQDSRVLAGRRLESHGQRDLPELQMNSDVVVVSLSNDDEPLEASRA